MNSISTLNNNLDTLKLIKIKENINTYLDLIADGKKTALDALIELTSLELEYKQDIAITSCVKVANFPLLKEIKDIGTMLVDLEESKSLKCPYYSKQSADSVWSL